MAIGLYKRHRQSQTDTKYGNTMQCTVMHSTVCMFYEPDAVHATNRVKALGEIRKLAVRVSKIMAAYGT